MESSILQKIGIDPAYILIGMLVLIIALFVLLFILMGNIKNRNKQIKRLLSGTQAGDLEDIIMKRFAEMVLTTESLVADLPEPPAPAAPAGGDMGGMY